MAKTVVIPEYVLKSALRHYSALARAQIPYDDLRALNAKREARKEIAKVERLMKIQREDGI